MNKELTLEEKIQYIEGYPYGIFLFEFTGPDLKTYYSFATWTATKEMIETTYERQYAANNGLLHTHGGYIKCAAKDCPGY